MFVKPVHKMEKKNVIFWFGDLDMLLRLKKLQTGRERSYLEPEPEVARLYRGTLVHQVVRELRRGITLDFLLVRGSSAERLFKQLKDAVVSLVGEDFIKNMRTGLEHKDAEKTQRDCNGQNQSIDELSSGFEHLTFEDIKDCDDDDDGNGKRRKSKAKDHKTEIHGISYTTRARHKAKARNANHPSKKIRGDASSRP